VLRFRLMVKRGPHMRPQASEGEAQHGLFCWTGRYARARRSATRVSCLAGNAVGSGTGSGKKSSTQGLSSKTGGNLGLQVKTR